MIKLWFYRLLKFFGYNLLNKKYPGGYIKVTFLVDEVDSYK